MSQSSLVTRQWWADPSNYTAGRSDTIHGIVVHHAASTSFDSIGQVFSQYGRGGSAHYGICEDRIDQYVREEDTAWHCGDWGGNCCTIGIECTNNVGAPDWTISEGTFNTLVKLCADIAKRNGLGKLKFGPYDVYPTLSAHRDWSATYCCGDYLYSRMDELAEKANKINYPDKKAELEWSKLDKPTTYMTIRDTHLYDFNKTNINDLVAIKSYAKDTEIGIYGKCYNKTIDKTFLVTEYSYTKGITNGFKDDALTVKPAEEPEKPSDEPQPVEPSDKPSEPEKPQDEPTVKPDGTGQPDNPRGLSDEEYQKVYDDMVKAGQIIQENAKENNAMIPMSNKVYDILKVVAIVILPLISATYVALSKIWGFGFGTEIDQTIQIIIAVINTILGVALVKSSSDYHKGDIDGND